MERALKGEFTLNTWIDQAAARVVKLNKELAALKKKYAIATKESSDALDSLRVVTSRATEAAERSGRAAAKSMIAARQVAIATMDPTSHRLLLSAEEAETAAETAAKAAAEAAELVHEVLLAARTVAADDVTTIRGSMTSVMIAIRAAEAATEATRLAQSVSALAGSVTLNGH